MTSQDPPFFRTDNNNYYNNNYNNLTYSSLNSNSNSQTNSIANPISNTSTEQFRLKNTFEPIKNSPMATAIVIGVGVAVAATAARFGLRALQKGPSALPKSSSSVNYNKFLRGGFEPKMTRREAALILGIRESAPKDKLKEAHRRIMVANHPDRGGSPYLASKINEAKDILEKGRR